MNADQNQGERGSGPLEVCARFVLPIEAQVFAARLTAEGLTARVMDSNTFYADGFAAGVGKGGIRVMVPASQLAEARRVLAALNAGEYAIDENFDPNP